MELGWEKEWKVEEEEAAAVAAFAAATAPARKES
jgi:hypothetical protein